MRGVFIAGTGTDVGKSVVAAALVRRLRLRGVDAGYFKPVGTGAVPTPQGWASEDALLAVRIAELPDAPEDLCPALFRAPVSPHLAARMEGRQGDFAPLDRAWKTLGRRHAVLVVEGAGGLAVPLDDEGTLVVDLPRRWGLPCVVVAPAGLGSINATLLTVAFARSRGVVVAGVVLNGGHGAPLEDDNARTIAALGAGPVFAVLPHRDPIDFDALGEALDAIQGILAPSKEEFR